MHRRRFLSFLSAALSAPVVTPLLSRSTTPARAPMVVQPAPTEAKMLEAWGRGSLRRPPGSLVVQTRLDGPALLWVVTASSSLERITA